MKGFNIYIAEDDEWYAELLRHHLELNPDYNVKVFNSGKALLDALHEKPDVITLDYSLPDTNGKKLKTDTDFVQSLLENSGVAVVQGSAFGLEGFFRISYATSMENLKKALKKISEFCSGLS